MGAAKKHFVPVEGRLGFARILASIQMIERSYIFITADKRASSAAA